MQEEPIIAKVGEETFYPVDAAGIMAFFALDDNNRLACNYGAPGTVEHVELMALHVDLDDADIAQIEGIDRAHPHFDFARLEPRIGIRL